MYVLVVWDPVIYLTNLICIILCDEKDQEPLIRSSGQGYPATTRPGILMEGWEHGTDGDVFPVCFISSTGIVFIAV